MAYMYGILSMIGWAALVIVLALLAIFPARKPDDSNNEIDQNA